jgi:hypothetical protein
VSYDSNIGTSLSGLAESLIALIAICKVSSLIVLLVPSSNSSFYGLPT